MKESFPEHRSSTEDRELLAQFVREEESVLDSSDVEQEQGDGAAYIAMCRLTTRIAQEIADERDQ